MVKKIIMVVAGAALVAAHCMIGGLVFADSYTQDGKPCPPECVSDSMEIVTWYPSPYNEYEELRLYPKRSAEESQCNSFEQLGLMYYNQDQQALKVCWQDPQDLSYSWKDVTLGISTNSGNVGIGTTEPQRPLEIDGGDRDTYIRLVSSPHNMAGIEMSGVGGDWKIERFYPGGYISGDILTFTKMGKGYHMAITADGNVGIGTTNPGAKLEVAGQVKITGGTPGVGKVLTSDANGVASWQDPPIPPICNSVQVCQSVAGAARELDGRTSAAATNNATGLCVSQGYAHLKSYSTATHSTSCGYNYGLANWNGSSFVWAEYPICGSDVTVVSRVECLS